MEAITSGHVIKAMRDYLSLKDTKFSLRAVKPRLEEKIMTPKEKVQQVSRLYHQFLRENGVTQQTVYANILWGWPEYLRAHKTF